MAQGIEEIQRRELAISDMRNAVSREIDLMLAKIDSLLDTAQADEAEVICSQISEFSTFFFVQCHEHLSFVVSESKNFAKTQSVG